ncbi:Conserved_hypothetical protein [Hexamita inflata]|uniref:Uncharacterized protein n=1 Tax=Hexamita inflata TaxID=28002 RepID=A0ABP1HZG2_9EUKA
MYLSNADQMQTQKSALPQVLESRERKQRLANSSVKVQLIQEQKQFRINEQIEITKRVKEAQLKKQQEIVQKQLQEQQNQKERAEQIRARFEQKEQELKRLKLEKSAKLGVEQDQLQQQNSNPANEQNFNPDFERTLKQKQEEELQKRILEEQRENIEAQKLLQKKKDAEEQKRKLELERSQQTEFILQKKKDETQQLLTKRLQDLKELNSQTELNKHKEHLLLLKQQEENEMRIRQSQNRTNSQIMFIQERKTLMKELDKIKLAQIENRTILQKQQQQQLEEENKLKKIKPVTLLYSKSTPKEPNAKQTVRIDVLQKQPRDEYILFFNKPKSTFKMFENVKIFDELQRLETYVYMHKFNINWNIPEINNQEEFEAENEKIFGLQKEWVQNLNLIRNEQHAQNSPAIAQLDVIVQLETQLLPAFQYCKCVGDIKTLMEETTQLRKIQIQMVNPEKDRQIFEKLQNEKLAQIEQYGYVLEALLHEQIEKRNKKLSGIERVIGLNQEFEFQLLQVESIDAYFACVRKYEREIQGTELDLVE